MTDKPAAPKAPPIPPHGGSFRHEEDGTLTYLEGAVEHRSADELEPAELDPSEPAPVIPDQSAYACEHQEG